MLNNEFDAQYYLNKIDANEPLTEQECLNMAYYFDIANEYGENRRWSRWVRTICNLNGRYFGGTRVLPKCRMIRASTSLMKLSFMSMILSST